MYRIIKVADGAEVGITEAVNYIKIGSSGSLTTATKNDAVGIAFDSIPYNLVGHDEIEGAETVVVSEIDGGTAVSHQQSAINEKVRVVSNGIFN